MKWPRAARNVALRPRCAGEVTATLAYTLDDVDSPMTRAASKSKVHTRRPAQRARDDAGARAGQPRLGQLAKVTLALVVILPAALFVSYFVNRTRDQAKHADSTAPTTPPGPAPAGMVWVPGGAFWMGDGEFKDARPVHRVEVDGFWMDKTEVTNAQFARFVGETGYVTVAEKAPDPKDFPGVPPEDLKAGSIVFTPPANAV